MKRLLFYAVIYVFISTCIAKLVHKTTDKPVSKIVKEADKPDVIAKDQNGDYINFNDKSRSPRNSVATQAPKNVTKSKAEMKKVLVKKPIPKYHEVNSDEDYQSRPKWPQNQDSVEHEDEDFNINDYDFDVNHDEFSSGRKPLEPRTKFVGKSQRPRAQQNQKVEKITKPKITRSLVNKKRNVNYKKIADKMKEEDYDQEFSTTTQSNKELKSDKDDDEESEESEDSGEATRAGVRMVRSPWHIGLGTYVGKLGEKTTNMMSKFFSILPIFPQMPPVKKISDDIALLDAPVANPLRGR